MSRRKRVLLWAAVLVLVGWAGLFVLRWAAPPAPGKTWANFRRIEKGMLWSEVEKLLDGPA